jgi:hypothetical protein
MTLTAPQREAIRRARDRAVRAGWDAHARRASALTDDVLLQALDYDVWRTTAQVGERLKVRRQEARVLGRALLLLPGVECEGGRGTSPRRFRRKIPPAG